MKGGFNVYGLIGVTYSLTVQWLLLESQVDSNQVPLSHFESQADSNQYPQSRFESQADSNQIPQNHFRVTS